MNPALNVSTHDHLATGAAGSKFGVTLDQAPRVLDALRAAGHTALGLHVHIGSAIRDAHDFTAAFHRLGDLRAHTGPLDVLDAGAAGAWAPTCTASPAKPAPPPPPSARNCGSNPAGTSSRRPAPS